MYNWKKRLLAAVLAGCMTVGLMAPALATVGGEDTLTTAGEVDPGFSVDPVYPVEPTDPVEPVEPTPPVETEIPDGEIPLDPGFNVPDYANMSTEELYEVVKDLSDEDRAIVYSLLTEEQIAALEEYEKAMADAELEAAYPAIDPVTVSGEDGVSVTVSAPVGAFPAGTELSIEPVTAPNPFVSFFSGEEDKKAVVEEALAEVLPEEEEVPRQTVAFDITFWLDGQEIQPAEGYTVNVSFSVANDSALLSEGTDLQAFRVDETAETPVAEPVGESIPVDTAAESQTVEVEAEHFTVYGIVPLSLVGNEISINHKQVTEVTYYLGQDINIGDVIQCKSNPTAIVPSNEKWSSDNTAVATVWYSEEKAQIIIRGVGTATITYSHTKLIGTQEADQKLILNIVEPVPEGALYIDDQIAENGCLVPVIQWNKLDEETYAKMESIETYEWSRSDGVAIRPEALDGAYAVENGVNAAVDRGGIEDEDKAAKTYTVTAKDAAGEVVASAQFTVPYGNEVLNGSFEQPGVKAWPNNTEGLYWLTTAPGTGGKLGMDVEIGSPTNSAYHTDRAGDGALFAELNAEAAGTLYQDVMTAPGAELNWSLMHRGRDEYEDTKEKDYMYVIIAAANQAQYITSQEQVNTLVNAAYGNYDGAEHTAYVDGKEVTFRIWEIRDTNEAWGTWSGMYTVPEGQYLTRFFFAAGSTAYDRRHPWNPSYTIGNLIDAVSFSTDMPYEIHYFLDGEEQTQYRETGKAAAYEKVTAENAGAFGQYAFEKGTLSGEPYADTTMIMLPGRSHVLNLYYLTKGVSVTKVVGGLADDLTQGELNELLADYTVHFELYDGETVVATADVRVSPETKRGSGVFVTEGGQRFEPVAGKTYTAKETAPPLDGYKFIGGNGDQSVTIPETQVGQVTFTNVYEEITDFVLTITKTVQGGAPEQDFLFWIENNETHAKIPLLMTAESFGNGTTHSETILMPAGTYTVREDTAYSWKYELISENKDGVVVDADQPSASFTNRLRETPGGNWLTNQVEKHNIFKKVETVSAMEFATMDALLPKATEPRQEDEQEGEPNNKQEPEPEPEDEGAAVTPEEGGANHV